MAKLSSRVMWGGILIIAGLLFLLESLGFLFMGSIWPVFFGIAGLLFLITFIRDTNHWWSVIPGMTLMSLAVVVLLNAIAPRTGDLVSGSLFLGGIGISFILILIASRGRQWWAIIPGGVLVTLACIALVSPYLHDDWIGAILMFGIAATFAIVYLIANPGGRTRWALYPAIVLGIIGVLLLGSAIELAKFIWPLAIIGLGLYVIVKNLGWQR